MQPVLLLCLACVWDSYVRSKPANIVFIITDDQDVALGGEIPMAKTKELIGDKGIIFNNMFVSSPLCCPSRSTILTGKFIHNHNVLNNSVDGGCGALSWRDTEEKNAFPTLLKTQGYTNFFAGKYLNTYGLDTAGGDKSVPPGWDWWNALVGNSVYYNYTLSINGTGEQHGDDPTKDYLTDVIHNQAIGFLKLQDENSSPFFMMLSTPACYGSATPATKYKMSFENESAPRDGSFNKHAQSKHWLIEQTETPMSNDTIDVIDDTFRNRWRTLLSVDDIVEDVVNTLDTMKMLDNTYIFFTSDNGFHLGQFSLPYDKRQFYDFDIRVPLMVRGPGIVPGQTKKEIIVNTDFAPTFIEIAGGKVPDDVDGLSMLTLFKKRNSSDPTSMYRTKFLIEHYGESEKTVKLCPKFDDQNVFLCDEHCVCEDSVNNTYACVMESFPNNLYKYCQMQDDDSFLEVYDLLKDPNEFTNIVKSVPPSDISQLSADLEALSVCSGRTCQKLQQT